MMRDMMAASPSTASGSSAGSSADGSSSPMRPIAVRVPRNKKRRRSPRKSPRFFSWDTFIHRHQGAPSPLIFFSEDEDSEGDAAEFHEFDRTLVTVHSLCDYARRSPVALESVDIVWQTLDHNGVVFPPAYVQNNTPFLYAGHPVALSAAQEEVAMLFAILTENACIRDPVFCANFFADFTALLDATQKQTVKRLSDCDFSKMWKFICDSGYQTPRAYADPAVYNYALVDGRLHVVRNVRVSPPALQLTGPFRGKVIKRVMPEDVILNIGKTKLIPKCPIEGHDWGGVSHDQSARYIALWHDGIKRNFAYWKGK